MSVMVYYDEDNDDDDYDDYDDDEDDFCATFHEFTKCKKLIK